MKNFTTELIYIKYACGILWKVLIFIKLESKKEKIEKIEEKNEAKSIFINKMDKNVQKLIEHSKPQI